MYGQRKPLADRVPLQRKESPSHVNLAEHSNRGRSFSDPSDILSTPSITDGETATETETETEYDGTVRRRKTATTAQPVITKQRSRSPMSHHDLLNRYFRKDTIFMHNLDVFRYATLVRFAPYLAVMKFCIFLARASDFMLLLAMFYPLASIFIPSLSHRATLGLHFTHALFWCLFHCFGLGLVLQGQSEKKSLVRHFMKHYHYPQRDGGKGAIQEAFTNWKVIYNLSMCMTYSECVPDGWTIDELLNWLVSRSFVFWTGLEDIFNSERLDCGERTSSPYNGCCKRSSPCHPFSKYEILSQILIALHVWASKESFEVLGVFGTLISPLKA